MARTFLITNPADADAKIALHNSPEHDHAALGAALTAAGFKPFRYDVLEEIKLLTTPMLRDEALSSLAWYSDILIRTAVEGMLKNYYDVTRKGAEVEDNPHEFADYDSFTKYIESLEPEEEVLYGFGIDVKERIESIHKLLAFRGQVHEIIEHDSELMRCRKDRVVNGVYYPPSADAIFDATPRERSISGRDELMFQELAKDEVQRLGLVDVDKVKAYTEAYIEQCRHDKKVENLTSLGWDKKKASALQTLWVCIGMTEASEGGEEATFLDLDAATQFKLLTRYEAALTAARARAIASNKLKITEKAAMRIECIEALKRLDSAVKHPRFADMG